LLGWPGSVAVQDLDACADGGNPPLTCVNLSGPIRAGRTDISNPEGTGTASRNPTQPGWYSDPNGVHSHQAYWDGEKWTGETRSGRKDARKARERSFRRAWITVGITLVIAVPLTLWFNSWLGEPAEFVPDGRADLSAENPTADVSAGVEPMGTMVFDFEDGPQPFVNDSVPGFSASTGNGVYRLDVVDYGFSHGQLPQATSSLEVDLSIAAITGSGDRFVGVGCAVSDGRGYYFGVDTSGKAILMWLPARDSNSSPSPIWEGGSSDVEATGLIQKISLACLHDPTSSSTRLIGGVNGVSLTEGVAEGDVGISFTNVALWFFGDSTWRFDVDEVKVVGQ
jgi:hypothetical protein